jgi:hypothetical protein
VGELDDVQLFYYFVESERSPKDDPLVLWLTGGPGCSAFSGLVYEIGMFLILHFMSSGTESNILIEMGQIIFFLKQGLKYEYILRQILSKLNITQF